jgi:hypothetical protein
VVGFYVHQILDFVWGDDFLCNALSGVILEVVADGIGLSSEPLKLAMRQIELARDFLNALESVPFLHLQTDGEHCVSHYCESIYS